MQTKFAKFDCSKVQLTWSRKTMSEKTSRFRGVKRVNRKTGPDRFESCIALVGPPKKPGGWPETIYLGIFDSEEEAARAHDRAARHFLAIMDSPTYRARFAIQNFPGETNEPGAFRYDS